MDRCLHLQAGWDVVTPGQSRSDGGNSMGRLGHEMGHWSLEVGQCSPCPLWSSP